MLTGRWRDSAQAVNMFKNSTSSLSKADAYLSYPQPAPRVLRQMTDTLPRRICEYIKHPDSVGSLEIRRPISGPHAR